MSQSFVPPIAKSRRTLGPSLSSQNLGPSTTRSLGASRPQTIVEDQNRTVVPKTFTDAPKSITKNFVPPMAKSRRTLGLPESELSRQSLNPSSARSLDPQNVKPLEMFSVSRKKPLSQSLTGVSSPMVTINNTQTGITGSKTLVGRSGTSLSRGVAPDFAIDEEDAPVADIGDTRLNISSSSGFAGKEILQYLKETDVKLLDLQHHEDREPEYMRNYLAGEDFLNYSDAPLSTDLGLDERVVPKITGVIFTGGGGKGTVYVGVLQALADAGILPNLTKLAGSSAGAITAALTGCLVRLPDGERISCLRQLVTLMLMDDFGNFTAPGVGYDVHDISKTAGGLLDEKLYSDEGARAIIYRPPPPNPPPGSDTEIPRKEEYPDGAVETTAKIAAGFGASVGGAAIGALLGPLAGLVLGPLLAQGSSGGGLLPGKTALMWLNCALNFLLGLPEGTAVTFQQYYVKTGVDLIITGTDINASKTVYFSKKTFPNLAVALAVRASMAFPGVFEPAVIRGTAYIDGGVYNNYPLDIFDIQAEDGSLYAYNTQVIGFDLKEKEKPIKVAPPTVKKALAAMASIHDMLNGPRSRGSPYWLRTCSIPVYNKYWAATTLGFAQSTELKASLSRTGYNNAMNFINWIKLRMVVAKRLFPKDEYLLSPYYRENIIRQRGNAVSNPAAFGFNIPNGEGERNRASYDQLVGELYDSEDTEGVNKILERMKNVASGRCCGAHAVNWDKDGDTGYIRFNPVVKPEIVVNGGVENLTYGTLARGSRKWGNEFNYFMGISGQPNEENGYFPGYEDFIGSDSMNMPDIPTEDGIFRYMTWLYHATNYGFTRISDEDTGIEGLLNAGPDRWAEAVSHLIEIRRQNNPLDPSAVSIFRLVADIRRNWPKALDLSNVDEERWFETLKRTEAEGWMPLAIDDDFDVLLRSAEALKRGSKHPIIQRLNSLYLELTGGERGKEPRGVHDPRIREWNFAMSKLKEVLGNETYKSARKVLWGDNFPWENPDLINSLIGTGAARSYTLLGSKPFSRTTTLQRAPFTPTVRDNLDESGIIAMMDDLYTKMMKMTQATRTIYAPNGSAVNKWVILVGKLKVAKGPKEMANIVKERYPLSREWTQDMDFWDSVEAPRSSLTLQSGSSQASRLTKALQGTSLSTGSEPNDPRFMKPKSKSVTPQSSPQGFPPLPLDSDLERMRVRGPSGTDDEELVAYLERYLDMLYPSVEDKLKHDVINHPSYPFKYGPADWNRALLKLRDSYLDRRDDSFPNKYIGRWRNAWI